MSIPTEVPPAIVSYVLNVFYRAIAGYHSARMFKTLKGNDWVKTAFLV